MILPWANKFLSSYKCLFLSTFVSWTLRWSKERFSNNTKQFQFHTLRPKHIELKKRGTKLIPGDEINT